MRPEDENVALLNRIYERYAAGDIKPLLDALAEDVEWESPGPLDALPWAGGCCGREAFATRLGQIGVAVRFVSITLERMIAQDDWVVTLAHYELEARATGIRQTYPKVDIFQLREGRIVRFREFYDTEGAVRHLARTRNG